MTTSKLPIVATKVKPAPLTLDQVEAVKEIAGCLESAEYGVNQIKGIISTYKNNEEWRALENHLDDWIELKECEENMPSPFHGNVNHYKTFHTNIAQKSAAKLAEEIEIGSPIALGFAIGQNAEFIQNATQNNKPLSDKANKETRSLFHATLAKNGMRNENGKIYMADENDGSKIKLDEFENPVMASVEQIRKVATESFPEQVTELSGGTLVIKTIEYDYVTQKALAQAKSTEKPSEPAITVPQVEKPAPSAEEEAPIIAPGGSGKMGG